jgi:hypothetical protein
MALYFVVGFGGSFFPLFVFGGFFPLRLAAGDGVGERKGWRKARLIMRDPICN